jgi:ABC-type branched-subunit amino acid transport system substrate-binding protein
MGVSAFIVLMSLVSAIGAAFADDLLTDKELLGRKIYREGADGSQNEITVTLGDTADSISATAFACANCHGLEGEGKQEGGLIIPTISSQRLFAHSYFNTSSKQVYGEGTLIRVISKGTDSNNKSLSAAMPRYRLADDQAQALIAYLKRLGTVVDVDSGITASEIRLGTLLPLTGPLAATGKVLEATLQSCIAELNRQGPLYGRQLTLTVLDSGETAENMPAAVQHLISAVKPFALVSGYFPEITSEIHELLVKENLPVIAPLTFVPKANPVSAPAFFYFLPSYADQSRALVDYWLASSLNEKGSVKPKLAIVTSDRTINVDAIAGIRAQLQRYHLKVAAEVVIPRSAQSVDAKQIKLLAKVKPDAIFFLGTFKELEAFNKALAKTSQRPAFLGLLAMLGAQVMTLPDLAMSSLLLASPFAQNDSGLQRMVCASLNFIGEGLKRTGKHVSRAKFIQSLATINSFPVAIMPPLQFDANNRQGIRGAYIFTINTKTGVIASSSDWVVPADY